MACAGDGQDGAIGGAGLGDFTAHVAGDHPVVFPVDKQNRDVAVLDGLQGSAASKFESAKILAPNAVKTNRNGG